MDPMTQRPYLIHHFLEESARQYPDKLALVHEATRATYAEVNARANSLAHYLLGSGVRAGDRIAILFDNSLDYVVSYYAVLKSGAVAVPLNTDLKPDSLKSILLELEPTCIVSSSKYERLLQAASVEELRIQNLILSRPQQKWSGGDYVISSLEDLIQDDASNNPNVEMQESELASIIYTSGSTGRPKGVMLSHGNIVSNTASICQYLRLTSSDIQMVVLPFFYVMGKSLLNTHFAVGGTVVINNKFAFPASVLNEMVAEKVTGFSGVPSTYAYLLHRSPLAKYRDKLTSLRYCSQAGGHMSRAVKEGLREVLPPHTDIVIMYGATEASARLSYLAPEHFLEKMDSIGKAIPEVTLRIVGENGNEVSPGQIGELVAQGPNIMQGYWKDQDSTTNALKGGVYHTGDQAYQDADGFHFLVGRNDDQLKVGGHRVNPHEVEDILMESGMLMESVVLGLPDGLLGHRLVACSVPIKNDCIEQQVLSFCAAKLPKFKVPGTIMFVRSLPKNSNGKVDRKRCLEFFGGKNCRQ
jgi:acyl-CoA synthetase (AMP-forming)/AMP-acid ligase II